MADFLLGLILSVLVGGAAFFLLRSNASWSLSRRKKADAVEVLPCLSKQEDTAVSLSRHRPAGRCAGLCLWMLAKYK